MLTVYMPMAEYFAGQQLLPGFKREMQLQIEEQPHWLASELPEDIQNELHEKYHTWNVEHDGWWDCVYENFKEKMNEIGFSVNNIYFSGFYSQGDGACFNGTSIDTIKLIKAAGLFQPFELKTLYNSKLEDYLANLHVNVSTRGRYSHSGTMSTDLEEYGEEDVLPSDAFSELETDIHEFLTDKADELYKILNEEYDYLTSKEAVMESLDANDFHFYNDGSEV